MLASIANLVSVSRLSGCCAIDAMGMVMQLLDKRGFQNNHVPVLVVRQKPVKSSLWRVSGYTV